MIAHRILLQLAFFVVEDINGLNYIAHIVAKCVALKSDNSGHIDVVQLSAKRLHSRAGHTINTDLKMRAHITDSIGLPAIGKPTPPSPLAP